MSQVGGIVNVGLTCYANAVIQCMRSCTKIPWIFEKGRYETLFHKDTTEDRKNKQILTEAFAEVIQLLDQCKPGQSVRPGTFWKSLPPCIKRTTYEKFATLAQHDSFEFYLCILDILHESLAQEVDMNILRKPVTERDARAVMALEVWKKEFNSKYSPLVDLFFGIMHVRMQCDSCSNITHRWETFSSLELPFPNDNPNPTLKDLMAEQLHPEKIEGYDCEKCATKRVVTKTSSIWRMPQNLVVNIKRFTWDNKKISTPVDMTAHFDFGPYLSDETAETKRHYSLRGVVDHHGSARGGHYTAQTLKDGTWSLYDDASVQEMPLTLGSSTYVLFFERD